MAFQKRLRAAPALAGGDPRIEQLGGGLGSEDSTPSIDLQRLRAAWIARRCAVSPDMAIMLASFILGEVQL